VLRSTEAWHAEPIRCGAASLGPVKAAGSLSGGQVAEEVKGSVYSPPHMNTLQARVQVQTLSNPELLKCQFTAQGWAISVPWS
jgi:hypothetical protein